MNYEGRQSGLLCISKECDDVITSSGINRDAINTTIDVLDVVEVSHSRSVNLNAINILCQKDFHSITGRNHNSILSCVAGLPGFESVA